MSWTYEKVSDPTNGLLVIGLYLQGEDIYPETVRRNTFWWSYTEGGTKTRKVDLFESNMAIAPEKCSHHCKCPISNSPKRVLIGITSG
jgi:hypothetical protein